MKKLSVLFVLAIPFLSIAQRPQEKINLTPEKRITLQLKKMELALTLSEDQVKSVRRVLENHTPKTEFNVGKTITPLTAEQRYEKQIEELDRKIAIQNSMKSILSESQFEQWKNRFFSLGRPMQKRRGKSNQPSIHRGVTAQKRRNYF